MHKSTRELHQANAEGRSPGARRGDCSDTPDRRTNDPATAPRVAKPNWAALGFGGDWDVASRN